MITSVLIANRGEIACRIIRTARAQGLRTVAVYSDADVDAPHVHLADQAVHIGPSPAQDSYLQGGRLIAAAQHTGADAIHPGYGFLSENAAFAEAVTQAGLIFIGPPASAIHAMGNKAEAKRLMIAANVPCVPGYEGADQSDEALLAEAHKIGLPIMVKAAAGGGGRGMRLVTDPAQLAAAITLARSEAQNAFGSGELILEKAILGPRHVEFQIFADAHGAIIHLGERDCSVQRRHQKVIEEAPCPAMTPTLRAEMGAAAIQAAQAVGYIGAGTVEFLLAPDGTFSFLEMNTRLQVEHPVTEAVTGVDLVAWQLSVAAGAPLSLSQSEVHLTGHAIEARLYAEDPAQDYLPVTGPIDLWQPASGPGVRVDAGIAPGQDISPFYDPMLAKIIASGDTREVARARLIKAVEGSVLLGSKTNSAFLAEVLAHPDFAAGRATTALLDDAYPDGFQDQPIGQSDLALAAALLGRADQQRAVAATGDISPMQLGWSSAPMMPSALTLHAEGTTTAMSLRCDAQAWHVGFDDGTNMRVTLSAQQDARVRADTGEHTIDACVHLCGERIALGIGARRLAFTRLRPGALAQDAASDGVITAPMPGLVLDLLVVPGAHVAQGDTLAVLEAMKMQHPLTAPFNGTVSAVQVQTGSQVAAGDVLIILEED